MNIERDKWYAVLIGQCIESARVDAIIEGKPICYVMGVWSPVARSKFLYESCDPQESLAETRRKSATARMEIHEHIYGGREPPQHGWPEHSEAIITRQGTQFHAGDYGIVRE